MIQTTYNKAICMTCKRELNEEEICKCGGYTVIFGDFKFGNGKLLCKCTSSKLKKIYDLNASPKHLSNYRCEDCGNIIGMKTEYRSPYK